MTKFDDRWPIVFGVFPNWMRYQDFRQWRDLVAKPRVRGWVDDVARWHLAGLRPVRYARLREAEAMVEAQADDIRLLTTTVEKLTRVIGDEGIAELERQQ